MTNAIESTLKNLGMELIAKDENKGVIFEIYRLKNCCLECYTYPAGKEREKKFFASSSKPVSCMDMLIYCQYNYKY